MIPTKMRAVVARDYQGLPTSLTVEELAIPRLQHGQVLVRIAASPINPSDLIFLKGQYGITKKLPVVPGFEASGDVVASGAGMLGRWLVGKRVSCRAPEDGNGTWAEYMVTEASGCIPLLDSVSMEAGASLIVNPMTAVALVDIARRHGHRSIVQTAAASALGRMVVRLLKRYRMQGIHIVRRPEQVGMLQALGAEQVLDSSDPGFEDNLREACRRYRARFAFDAVGGELTGRLLGGMPTGSTVLVYGALSGEACQVNPIQFIFRGQQVRGFWLSEWIKQKSWPSKLVFARRVQRWLAEDLRTDIQGRFPLSQIHAAIDQYKKNRSSGKVLLVPSAVPIQ